MNNNIGKKQLMHYNKNKLMHKKQTNEQKYNTLMNNNIN